MQFYTVKIKHKMNDYIKNLNGLNLRCMLISVIIASLISLGVYFWGSIAGGRTNVDLSLVAMLLIMLFLFRGRKLFNNKIKGVKNLAFGEKLNVYQKAHKDRVNSFNAINIIASIGLIITGEYMYLIFVVLGIFLIAASWVTTIKLKIELGLNEEELAKLSKKE